MRRDKLFDIEMYKEGAILDCSSSDVCHQEGVSKLYCQNVPLFAESQCSFHFGVKQEEEEVISDTEELLLLQLLYW